MARLSWLRSTAALYPAFLVFQSTTASSIWRISLDYAPAPLPADGPPISAHASRDRSLLKYQIIAIVGAYFALIVIIGLALLVIGRPLRRAAMSPRHPASATAVVAVSAHSSTELCEFRKRAWRRIVPRACLGQVDRKTAHLNNIERPAVTFDEKIVERDRGLLHEEMEKLYAVVMENEVKAPKRLSMDITGSDVSPVQRVRSPVDLTYSPSASSPRAQSPRYSWMSDGSQALLASASYTPGIAPFRMDTREDIEYSEDGHGRTPGAATTRALPRLSPIKIPPNEVFTKRTATASTQTLPFRAGNNVRTPLPTKLTFLSPRHDAFRDGPLRSAVWMPGTAGLATPYSPYMPFTPVTPVMPHLVSRAERLQRERDEGTRAPTAEDEVVEDGEKWNYVA